MQMIQVADGDYLLEKFPGKGGWIYALIHNIPLHRKQNPFGWLEVKGSVDGIEINDYKLMPMKNGALFLPVKAELRKKIGKKEGDLIHVQLFANILLITDNESAKQEILACFELNDIALKNFNSLNSEQKDKILNEIIAIENDNHRIAIINRWIDKLSI